MLIRRHTGGVGVSTGATGFEVAVATRRPDQPKRSFIARMADASASVTALAATMGQAPSSTPYASHSATPAVKTLYMPSEMPLTSRVRKVSQACGTKLQVVRMAAR